MSVDRTFQNVNLRYAQHGMDRTGQRCIVNVSGMASASVSALHELGTWGTAVITIKQSNNPAGPWVAVSGASTLTLATPSSGTFTVSSTYILADITTGENAESSASISFNARVN